MPLRAAYDAAYRAQYGRLMDGVDVECVACAVIVSSEQGRGTEIQRCIGAKPSRRAPRFSTPRAARVERRSIAAGDGGRHHNSE